MKTGRPWDRMCCGPMASWEVVWSQAGPWKETLPLTELSLLAEGTKQFSPVFCPSSYLAGQQEPCSHPTLPSAR